MKRKLLLAALAVIGALGFTAQAQTWSNSDLADGKYIFKNIGSGRYLGPSNSWGTQASLIEASHFNTLAKVSDGVYTIESQVSNGGTNYYFTGTFMDGAAAQVTIKDNGSGIFTMSNGTTYYGYNGSSTVLANNLTDPTSANAQWEIVSYDDYLASATAENPVDASYRILCQNFDRNHRSAGAWTMVASNQNLSGGTDANRCAESWRAAFTLSQKVTLPNGYYKVRAQAACWEYTVTGADYPVVYAGNVTVPFNKMTDDSGGMNGFSARFTNGEYYTDWSDMVTVTTKNLTVGVKGTRTDTWCIWDNIQLMYYGPLDLSSYAQGLADAIAEAKAIRDGGAKIGSSVASNLATVISTYEGKTYESEEEYVAVIEVVTAAIANANNSIASYEALKTAIANANNHTVYTTVFETSAPIYNAAVATAQGVYDAAEVDDCAAAITALTNGIYSAYENDYSVFDNDYAYDYSTLLSQDMTKWASTDYVTMTANEHWNGLTDQKYYEQSSAEWNQNAWSHAASETATLPAGNYVMSITARASADVASSMSVRVGDNEPITVALPNKGATGFGITTGGIGSYADGTYANSGNGFGWEYRFIAFEVTEESPVTISFSSSTNAIHNWVSLASPLLKGDVHPNQIKLNQLNALAATLTGYESQITEETYATFASDITAAGNATLESTDLDIIIGNLKADIETAKAEAAAFERGAAMNALINGANSVVLTDEATAANWTPEPTYNDWSTEADGTGMVKPFLQNWIDKNNGFLADNSLTYAPIRGLEKGYYEVSALVRVYSESGNEPSATSAVFTVNDASVDLLDGEDFEYENMKGVYKTVSVKMEIKDALNIGLAYSGANFNWIAWKNLKVTYLGDASMNVAISDGFTYGTFVAPFDVEIPAGVTAYTVSSVDGVTLQLDEMTATIPANKPVLIYSEGVFEATTAYGKAEPAENPVNGLLTGVYTATSAPVGSWVLQNLDGKEAFYRVAEGQQPTVPANKAYLTYGAAGASVRGLFFPGEGGEATGIAGLDVLTSGSFDAIYTANGVQVESLQKGLNIVVKDGKSYKIFVK